MLRINETKKSWFFEKVNRIDKPLATLTRNVNERMRRHK